MRIYRVLGLVVVAVSAVWFIVVVVDSGGRVLAELTFLLVLIWLGLALCNFVPVTKDDDDSLLLLWYEAKKEKLKKEIKEIKKKNND